ncbi:hypothetical protein [Rhizobium sp. L43]|uniref:helix-turn-helix transcriptional regulator n=1 Tax=Rhizobium sp. L43 TaxID=2035452 RepID=UPI000BE7D800|nr:hypothetical protein [Rhizobium sp. L43]PDS80145.1 hypothetical protein CO667_06525 [Rhizobium sp. L43]
MDETLTNLIDDCDRLLKEDEIRAITGISPTVRWRLRKKGEFPQLILGRFNSMGQIREWIAAERKKAEAQAKAAIVKSSLPPKRGRPRKVPAAIEVADTEADA